MTEAARYMGGGGDVTHSGTQVIEQDRRVRMKLERERERERRWKNWEGHRHKCRL